MAIDSKTLAAARKYTDQSVAGGGAIKGKNCVVDSIISITGGHRVTFKWTLDDGTVLTNYMDVMDGVDGADGADGADGRGIDSVNVDANNHLIVTYDDGTDYDAGEIQVTGQTIQRNVLPTASVSELGNIYQYIGATDANYTNGYFYQCVADGVGYKWENKKVQSGGGSGVDNFKDLDDVSFSSLTDGDLPQYNQASGKWENSNQIPLGIQHLQGSMANLQVAIHNLDLLVASKVDKVPGKDLSTNDFTNDEKQKLGKLQPIYLIGSGLNLNGSVLSATGISIPIDQQLDSTSPNPVQNKAIAVPVQALQGSMSQVKLDVNQLKASDIGIKSDIANIKLDINQLKGSDIAIKNDIGDIKLDINQLKGSDIAIKNDIGDIKLDVSQLQGSLATKANKATTLFGYGITDAVNTSQIGSNNGVAGLGSDGKVPAAQLPSYVDDVLEYSSQSAFPATGESGKIYVDLSTNKTYRWSGSAYVVIGGDLALGETSTTAYAGNKGKANADAIAAIKDGTSIDSFGDVETALNGKQATISDLSTIRSGASAGATAYQKPSTGVPKSDFESGVQTSLGKADTAYQKPSTGVPKSDLASDVQTSLGKADTALQSHQSLANYYQTGDTAETDLQDADYFPFYDSSATGKRKTLWSNIKSKLKSYFDTIYGAITPTPASSITESALVSAINGSGSNDKKVTSSYGTKIWSNVKTVRRVLDTGIGSTGIGTWDDSATPVETDWWHDNVFIIPDNADNVDIDIKFDPALSMVVVGGYIWDTTTGKICIKFAAPVDPSNTRVAVDINYTRNEVV